MIPLRLVRAFLDAIHQEVQAPNLPPILETVGLSPADLEQLNVENAADLYARVQKAVRLFYGRGARGLLLWVGQAVWEQLTNQANLVERAKMEIIRHLPPRPRLRGALELVAGYLCDEDRIHIHTLDLELLLVDDCSVATNGQQEDKPICYVTVGLIQAALLWAVGSSMDVEEIACKATGAPVCQFKIKYGGT